MHFGTNVIQKKIRSKKLPPRRHYWWLYLRYQLVGRGTRRCYADGWDGQVPLCEIVKCPDPPEIEDGEIMNLPSGNVVYSTAILYRCKKGVLIGNKELVCTAQGNYSSKPPQCKGVKRTLWKRFKNAVKESVSEAIHWLRGLA
ncbi:UNVERIFIED_CONTAM: hypothetical protein FKN15_036629 [Acipenser sinensis]